MMTSRDFKKDKNFRNCLDKCCLNCKYKYTKTSISYGSNGETIQTEMWCNCDPSNRKIHFMVQNDTVCDNWELKTFW